MVSPLSVLSLSDNQFCRIISQYSVIVNSSQKLINFENTKVKDNAG